MSPSLEFGEAAVARSDGAKVTSYRPDIDGLRALAVLAVIGFHALPTRVRGGYVGVDVFFVISGYLITSVIVSALDRKAFTLAGFYGRRVRRIFPALAVLLASCFAWSWFNLFADDFEDFGKYLAASAGFVPNLAFWRSFWYFDNASELKPLLHLWSLGIEEQFYLVWPLLIVAAWKWRRSVLPLTMLIASASFLASVYIVRYDASAAFYSPLLRAWELALGAMVAGAANSRVVPLTMLMPERLRDAASLVGLALVIVSVFAIGQTKTMLGLRMAIPTMGAALMIAAGPLAWLNRRILSMPLLVWIGLISYPLYLWHWPLLSFATIKSGQPPTGVLLAVLISTSVLLAWVTYRVVEYPIRFGPATTWTIPALCTALTTMLVAGAVTYAATGFPERKLNLSDRGRFIQYYERMHKQGLAEAYRNGCDFLDWTTRQTKTDVDSDCTRRGTNGTVFLWGDSFAQALSLGIRRLLPRGVSLAQVTTSGCPPDEHETDKPNDERCSRSNSRAIDAIRELTPDVVVLAQADRHDAVDWEAKAARIRTLGARRVVVVGPAPVWRPSLPLVVAGQYWGGDFSRVRSGLEPTLFTVDAALKRRLAGSHELTYVSLVDRLCNADGCLAIVPGGDAHDLIAVDIGHFTPAGSIFVANLALRSSLGQ